MGVVHDAQGFGVGTLGGNVAVASRGRGNCQVVVVCSCGSSTGRRLGDLLPKDECP